MGAQGTLSARPDIAPDITPTSPALRRTPARARRPPIGMRVRLCISRAAHCAKQDSRAHSSEMSMVPNSGASLIAVCPAVVDEALQRKQLAPLGSALARCARQPRDRGLDKKCSTREPIIGSVLLNRVAACTHPLGSWVVREGALLQTCLVGSHSRDQPVREPVLSLSSQLTVRRMFAPRDWAEFRSRALLDRSMTFHILGGLKAPKGAL